MNGSRLNRNDTRKSYPRLDFSQRGTGHGVGHPPDVIAALTVCWMVLGMPAGKRLAPMLNELVMVLRHFGELVISDATAALLVSMSAATIDRRLAPERRKHQHTWTCRHQAGIADE